MRRSWVGDVGGGEDRIALYADDILLYIPEAQSSGSRILKILQVFEEATGLRINRTKSLLVPIQGDGGDGAWAGGFPIKRLSFKYLGMTVSLEPGLAWSLNIVPLIRRTREYLKAWENLPLNTLGKVANLKMMILPKFLYVMQHYPRRIPAEWFGSVNTLFRTFLWGNKLARISFAKCCQSTFDGGWP